MPPKFSANLSSVSQFRHGLFDCVETTYKMYDVRNEANRLVGAFIPRLVDLKYIRGSGCADYRLTRLK